MKGGYAGKLLFANLTKGTLEEEPLSEELTRNLIGGYGIGARLPQSTPERFIEAATGWDLKAEDVIQTGKRIMNMRYAFNLREGQKLTDDENALPKRCVGEPPLKEGPLKGVTVNHKKWACYFSNHMGWDEETRIPTRESLKDLGGMEDVIRDLDK